MINKTIFQLSSVEWNKNSETTDGDVLLSKQRKVVEESQRHTSITFL